MTTTALGIDLRSEALRFAETILCWPARGPVHLREQFQQQVRLFNTMGDHTHMEWGRHGDVGGVLRLDGFTVVDEYGNYIFESPDANNTLSCRWQRLNGEHYLQESRREQRRRAIDDRRNTWRHDWQIAFNNTQLAQRHPVEYKRRLEEDGRAPRPITYSGLFEYTLNKSTWSAYTRAKHKAIGRALRPLFRLARGRDEMATLRCLVDGGWLGGPNGLKLGRGAARAGEPYFIALAGAVSSLPIRKDDYVLRGLQKVGSHSQVPWRNEAWWTGFPLRFLHQCQRSTAHPGQLSYFQNLDKLGRDVRTAIKPGRYLQKYFGKDNAYGTPPLSEEEIRDWTQKWEAMNAPIKHHLLDNNDPKWAGDERGLRREWYRLYDEIKVDYSCMRGNVAVEAYGVPGNNLGLLYWEEGGELVSRCIVNTERMTFVRTYPCAEERSGHQLGEAIVQGMAKALGYKHDQDATLDGVSLHKIQLREGVYAVPYLDGGTCSVRDDGQYWVICDDGIDACSSSGELEAEERRSCDHCGGRFHEDDLTYVERYDCHVCDSCLNEQYVSAYCRHNYTERALVDDCGEVGGNWYHVDHLDRHGITTCDGCGEYVKLDDTERDTDDNKVCDGCADGRYTRLDHDHSASGSDLCPDCDARQLPDGTWCHADDYEELLAEQTDDEDEAEVEPEPIAA